MSVSGISVFDKDRSFQGEYADRICTSLSASSGLSSANAVAQSVLEQSSIKPTESHLSSRSISPPLRQGEIQGEAPAAAPVRWKFVDETLPYAEDGQSYDQKLPAFERVTFIDETSDAETYSEAERSAYFAEYYLLHRNKIRTQAAQYYQDHRDKRRVQFAANYQDHQAERRAQAAQYYQDNQAKRKKQFADYYQTHRDKIREKARLRRTARRVAEQSGAIIPK